MAVDDVALGHGDRYVLPIEPCFLFGEEARFTDLIVKFITEFKAPADPGIQPGAVPGI